MAINYADLSADLKGKCVKYVTKNLLDDFYASPFGEAFKEFQEDHGKEYFTDESYPAWVDMIDKFILFGETKDDGRVLDKIIEKVDLKIDEKFTAVRWRDQAFLSVFEIKAINPHWLKTFDVIAEVNYNIHSNNLDIDMQTLLGKAGVGDFMRACIVPVGHRWYLSGTQQMTNKSNEKDIFEQYILDSFTSIAIYRNNKAKLEKAFKVQKKHYDKFVKHFRKDKIRDKGIRLQELINDFYNHFPKKTGENIEYVDLPEIVSQSDNVTAIMHPRQGLYFLNDYHAFTKIFSKLEKSAEWDDLVLAYLDSEDIPAFVFEEMKDKYPNNFRKIINEVIESEYDPVNNFEGMMDYFKPILFMNHPQPQKTKKSPRLEMILEWSRGRSSPAW